MVDDVGQIGHGLVTLVDGGGEFVFLRGGRC